MIVKDKDNFDLKKLQGHGLPIIESVNHLLSLIEFTDEDEKNYLFSKNRENIYRVIKIPKKNKWKKKRIIEIPCKRIYDVQKAIYNVILKRFKVSEFCNSYVKGKSIKDNAVGHIGCKTLLKFDITDFFPSIKMDRVYRQFRFYGYGENVSKYLSYLCLNKNLVLPQGAPTSPALSNIVCVRLDKRIGTYCKNNDLVFSRYADDITISSKEKLTINQIEKIRFMINKIIKDEKFEPNESKFHYFFNGQRLMVTGLVVNNSLSVPKEMYDELDNAIRFIRIYGLNDHLKHIKSKIDNYQNHLFGIAYYIKSINEYKGKKYIEDLIDILEGLENE